MLNDYNRFYVYAYLRNDGTVYYIGKGSGPRYYRAFYKGINEIKPPRNKNLIIIVADKLTELWAYALERRLIRWYGRKDNGTGILRNKSEGGEGSSGYKHTSTAKQKIGKSSKGRTYVVSDDTKIKMSKSATGRKRTPESVEKTRLGNLGKKRTPEQIQKIKDNTGCKKGYKQTHEHKMKILKTKIERGLIKKCELWSNND